MGKTVLGVFEDRIDADSAIDDLYSSGFDSNSLSIVMKDGEGMKSVEKGRATSIGEDIVSGAATGGVIGGIAGLLLGLGVVTIPGIGVLLIGGPLVEALGLTGAVATTVSAATTGVVAGGIIGGLSGLGIPEEEAKIYEDRVRSGAILLAVATPEEGVEKVKDILEDNNVTHMRTLNVPENESLIQERQEAYHRPTFFAGAKGGKSRVRKKIH